MERRDFLKLTFGFVAASALAATAQAAPLPPPMPAGQGLAPPRGEGAEPAVATQDDIDKLAPEPVRWRRWGFRRRRFYGFRRRRYWGYRRRWHRRRYWRRRFW